MAYLNFNKITPPAPNDPLVNEVTQLNDNWDQLDTKLQPYMIGGSITDLETGQEFFDGDFRYCVWDGAAPRLPDNISAGWSAWTAFPMNAPRAARSGLIPKWRNNSLYRMVECVGGVLFNAAADPWTLGSAFTINTDTANSPPSSMVPIGAKHVSPLATGIPSAPAIVAGAMATVDVSGTHIRIQLQHLGGPGGGNFIQLDQLWWWY